MNRIFNPGFGIYEFVFSMNNSLRAATVTVHTTRTGLRHTYPGIPLVLLCANVHDNLELCLVESHKAEVEAGEEAGEELEDADEDDHGPERQHQRVHFYLVQISINQ